METKLNNEFYRAAAADKIPDTPAKFKRESTNFVSLLENIYNSLSKSILARIFLGLMVASCFLISITFVSSSLVTVCHPREAAT